MKKKAILLGMFMVLFTTSLMAQSASTDQIGLRLGGFSGIDYKGVFADNLSIRIDAMERYPWGRGMLEGLLERNFPITGAKGLVLVIGVGGFVGTDFVRVYNDDFRYKTYYLAPIPGLTAEGGLDFYIPGTPVVIGADIRPRISFFGAYPWDAAVSGRLVF